jgi:uncharacterized membrane protein
MIHVSESIAIARAVETVFAFAGDYRNDPQWRAGITEMIVTPDGEIKAGSVTREVLHFAGRDYITEANVVVWRPNQKTAFKSFVAAIPVEGERLFERTYPDTTFTYNLTTCLQSRMDRLMMPILAILFRNQVRNDLKKLKKLLERNSYTVR